MTEELWDLPPDWSWAASDDVARVELELVDAKQFPDAIHIAPNHIASGTGQLLETGTVRGDKVAGPKHRFRKGQVLYSKIRPYLAKAVIAPCDGFCSSDMYPLTPRIDPAFLLSWLVSPAFTERVSKDQGRTVLPKVNLVTLKRLPVPVPPAAQQRRIVAKLEALQARSRRAREALEAVPPLLEKLRQSILAAAFRGDLTKDWRGQNPDVRTTDLTAAADAVAARGKRLWGSGRTEGTVSATWPPIPASWRWTQVRDVNEDPGAAVQIGPMSMRSNEFIDSGRTVLNVGCVQRGRLDLSKANYLPESRAQDFGRYRLSHGDVLFTRSGTVGRCACVPPNVDGALMTFHLLRVRSTRERCEPAFLAYAFQGSAAVADQIKASSVGATRAGFNTRLLEDMWIPLPPREEQRVILSRIDRLFAPVDALQQSVDDTFGALSRCDSATLATAFRGALVHLDASDAPAADAMLAASQPPTDVASESTPKLTRASKRKAG